jgi:hypothetical protein
MSTTLTAAQETAIRDWLAAHPTLSVGVGNREAACSIAAINLALTGELKDNVPDCMSAVIGRWAIGVQDAMPAAIRESAAWRDLLPLAAGTGRAHEPERLALVLGWVWDTVLPLVQLVADQHGFGEAWRRMCEERTADAAYTAAYAAADADAYAAYDAAADAVNAANAANAVNASAYFAAAATNAANSAATNAAYAADAADVANADADYDADAYAAAYAAAWATLDPVGLLRRLIALTDPRALKATP